MTNTSASNLLEHSRFGRPVNIFTDLKRKMAFILFETVDQAKDARNSKEPIMGHELIKMVKLNIGEDSSSAGITSQSF